MVEVQIDKCCKETEYAYMSGERVLPSELDYPEHLIVMAGIANQTHDQYGVRIDVDFAGEILSDELENTDNRILLLAAKCPGQNPVLFDAKLAADGTLTTKAELSWQGRPLGPGFLIKSSEVFSA